MPDPDRFTFSHQEEYAPQDAISTRLNDPADVLERVQDRASFFEFVHALILDRADSICQERCQPSSPYEADANGWGNTHIETFLEAALSCAESTKEFPSEPSWKAFAEFLYFGKVYE